MAEMKKAKNNKVDKALQTYEGFTEEEIKSALAKKRAEIESQISVLKDKLTNKQYKTCTHENLTRVVICFAIMLATIIFQICGMAFVPCVVIYCVCGLIFALEAVFYFRLPRKEIIETKIEAMQQFADIIKKQEVDFTISGFKKKKKE